MAKTVITGAAGATTSTNAAVTDADGKYFPHYGPGGQAPAAADGAYLPPK